MTHRIDISKELFQEASQLGIGTISLEPRKAKEINAQDELILEVTKNSLYTGDKLNCEVNTIIPGERFGVPNGFTTIGFIVNKTLKYIR